MPHKVESFANIAALATLVNLTHSANSHASELEYHPTEQTYAILAAMMQKRGYFAKKVSFRSPGLKCSYGEIFIGPSYQNVGGKTEILVIDRAHI